MTRRKKTSQVPAKQAKHRTPFRCMNFVLDCIPGTDWKKRLRKTLKVSSPDTQREYDTYADEIRGGSHRGDQWRQLASASLWPPPRPYLCRRKAKPKQDAGHSQSEACLTLDPGSGKPLLQHRQLGISRTRDSVGHGRPSSDLQQTAQKGSNSRGTARVRAKRVSEGRRLSESAVGWIRDLVSCIPLLY